MENVEENMKLCRLCATHPPVLSLFEDNGVLLVESLTSIKVKKEDNLPKSACTQCWFNLKVAYLIRQSILEADRKLKRLMDQLSSRTESRIEEKRNKLVSYVCGHCNKSYKTKKNFEKHQQSLNLNKLVDVPDTVNDDEDNSICAEETKENTLCNICGITCRDQESLKSHQKNHSKSTCPICNLKIVTRNYKRHMKLHDSKISCPECGMEIRSDQLKKHLQKHDIKHSTCDLCGKTSRNPRSHRIFCQKASEATRFVCEKCGRVLKTQYLLKIHTIKQHTGERRHKCNTCGKAFFSSTILRYHIDQVHKKLRPFVCDICGKDFTQKYYLTIHLREHVTGKKRLECHLCPSMFGAQKTLDNHLKSKHNIVQETMFEFRCHVCKKGFNTEIALNTHMLRHNEKKCSACSETFADEEYFSNHVKDVHNSDSPEEYLISVPLTTKCNICGKVYFNHYQLAYHVDTVHNKVKAYKCRYCEKSFPSNAYLKIHERKHTNERPFGCDQCNEKYNRMDYLMAHKTKKHGLKKEENYFCQVCNKGFCKPSALKLHVNRFHVSKKCKFCSDTFGDDEHLLRHISDIHGC